MATWRFQIAPDTAVVTTSYVMQERMPILDVIHELDEDGSPHWQFHCGNGDYRGEVLRLVRPDQILALDPDIGEVLTMPSGSRATRASPAHAWVVAAYASPDDSRGSS